MNAIGVSEYIEGIGTGNHISCVYRSDEELFSFLVPYFSIGLQNNNKCAYILGEQTADIVLNKFKNFGIDLSLNIENGSFLFIKKEDIYLRGGYFYPETAIQMAKKIELDALKEGYGGLWISGDASWIMDYRSMESDYIKYEANINTAVQNSTINAVCLYNELLFDKNILIEVLRTHPHLYLYNHFVTNNYYAVDEDFSPLKHTKHADEEYEKLISAFNSPL
jgi:hypothetical protein